MLLIVLNHGLQSFPLVGDPSTLFVNDVLMNFGGVGDDLFFIITVWFLSSEIPSMKKSTQRVWKLEQIVLFWSIMLFLVFLLSTVLFKINVSGIEIAKIGVKSFFPNLTNMYWYTASYILFLLIYPWLQNAILALTQTQHRRLSTLLIVLFYIIPRGDIWQVSDYSVIAFIILYIVFTYIKKYHSGILDSRRISLTCIGIGLLLGVSSLAITSLISPSGEPNRWIMNLPTKIPSLLISFGLISLVFSSKPYYNGIVNKLSSTMLASYLVIAYPHVTSFIVIFLNKVNLNGLYGLAINIVACISLITIVSLCDLVRMNVIFKYILCRHPNKYFERFYSLIKSLDKRIVMPTQSQHTRSGISIDEPPTPLNSSVNN